MANYGLLWDDLKEVLDDLPEDDREDLLSALKDVAFSFKLHGKNLDRILSDSVIAKLQKTMTPHFQSIAMDMMLGGGVDWKEFFEALTDTFPELK